MVNWHRVVQCGCGFVMGGVAVAFLLAPDSVNVALVAAGAAFAAVLGFSVSFHREGREAERREERAALARAPRPQPQEVPEAALPLHEEMRDRVAATRDALSRMVDTASRMHNDRVSVHARCQRLEEEREHLIDQVVTANRARDVLSSLQAPPLALGERPWPAPRVPSAEAVMRELREVVSEGREPETEKKFAAEG